MIKMSDQVSKWTFLHLIAMLNQILSLAQITDVIISLYINRISGVDENKEEISFDVFLQVIWTDKRIEMANETNHLPYVELTAQERHKIWVRNISTYKTIGPCYTVTCVLVACRT